jgi:hypothetical protein
VMDRGFTDDSLFRDGRAECAECAECKHKNGEQNVHCGCRGLPYMADTARRMNQLQRLYAGFMQMKMNATADRIFHHGRMQVVGGQQGGQPSPVCFEECEGRNGFLHRGLHLHQSTCCTF